MKYTDGFDCCYLATKDGDVWLRVVFGDGSLGVVVAAFSIMASHDRCRQNCQDLAPPIVSSLGFVLPAPERPRFAVPRLDVCNRSIKH